MSNKRKNYVIKIKKKRKQKLLRRRFVEATEYPWV